MESSAPFDFEVQVVIKFLNAEGVTGSEIHRRLSNVYRVHLIPNLKCDSGSQHFATEEDLQSAIVEFFTKQDAVWYSAGIHKYILGYNNCYAEQSDYVEK